MKQAIKELIELSDEIFDFYYNQTGRKILTDEDIIGLNNFKITLIKTEKEDDIYKLFGNLFKSIYHKNTKYKFLYNHEKLRTYIIKNKTEICVGSNISEAVRKAANAYIPLYKIFNCAVVLNIAHQKRIAQDKDVYTIFDDDYTYFLKIIGKTYGVFYHLEKKTQKRNDLKEVIDWAEAKIDKNVKEDEESNMREALKQSMNFVKGTDMRSLVAGFGFNIPEEININEVLDTAMEGQQGEDMIDNLINGISGIGGEEQQMAGGMESINEGINDLFLDEGNVLEELEKEVYESEDKLNDDLD